MVEAVEELRSAFREARVPMREARSTLGKAIAGATFDEAAWRDADRTFETATQKFRLAARSAVAKIHAALDDRQRQRLSTLLTSGFAYCC